MDKSKKIENMGIYIIKNKFIIILLLIALSVLGVVGMNRLKMDSSNESFLPKNDPVIIKNEQFKEIFGNEEFIYILVESSDLFSSEVLQYISELTEDIQLNLPFVDQVTSLSNLEYIEAEDNALVIEDLFGDQIPTDPVRLKEIKDKILSKKTYLDRIISQDGKMTGIFVTFKEIPDTVYAPVGENFTPLDQLDFPAEKILLSRKIHYTEKPGLTMIEDPRKLIAPALDVILSRHHSERVKVTPTGVPLMDFEADRLILDEGSKFGLIALVMAVVIMFLLYRSFRAVIGPFLVILSTIIILLGLMGWLDIRLSLLSVIIPTLILVISVSYSIHIINHFQYAFARTGSRKEAVRYAYRESTWPIFITVLTTALGFVSFAVVPMQPIKIVGIACALGAFLTYLLVMTIIPIIFSLGSDAPVKGKKQAGTAKPQTFQRLLVRWADFISNKMRIISVFTLLLIIIMVYFSLQMPINSDMMKIIGDKIQFVKDAEYITEKMGALYSYEVLLELPEKGMAKKSRVLTEVEGLNRLIGESNLTVTTMALTDLIKEMNMTLNNNQDKFYSIPKTDREIAQYLLLYEFSGGEGIEEWVDFGYRKLHISVQLNKFSREIENDFQLIREYVQNNFPEGSSVAIVGDMPLMMKMLERLTEGQIQSIITALIVITLVMMVVLKSPVLGLISMIPNLIPVIVITGLMGLLNYPLDLVTILIAPMIIGIAVDDTVHYFVHFKDEYLESHSYYQANRETFKKIGKALIATSVILMLGFGIFGLSRMESLIHMGILSAAGILAALVADMLITPAIMLFFKPLNQQEKFNEVEDS